MYGGSVADGWLYFGGLFFDPTVTADMVTDAGLVPTVDFLFQSAFANRGNIVSGLVAERVKFGEFVAFAIVLTVFIYPIAVAGNGMVVGLIRALSILLVLQLFTQLEHGQVL